ncbi:putative peptidase family-domain-containing protein [Tricharina praecox]|uniref:putative peptidase family-domain-containing protein n=1 Tax=Tricharina praecox TaxID=43433 RepID=UPI00221EBCCB|nr:putative peptidase family-domain-containing protein [Tricharina praecox]KAI5856876.1 putative peptidase family-domain-containing protein [Tricharina praecox]
MFSHLLTACLAVSAAALSLPNISSTHETAFSLPAHTPVIGPQLHATCNSTNTAQLTAALQDTAELSLVARQYLLENGRTDPVFTKYFGVNGTTAPVVGVFDNIVSANKPGVLFRCDDVDGNCARDATWAGHWRGSNATSETVICDTSYVKRLRLAQMCTQGYTVAGSKTNVFWASDLLHRLFHVPSVSEDAIHHTADGYAETLELATHEDGEAVHNSDSLLYFALEVYALRVSVPGVGCLGTAVAKKPSPMTTAIATPAAATTLATTTMPKKECHTHADGAVHC